MDSLVARLATAPLRSMELRKDWKFSRACARNAAHWAIAVVYQRTFGRIPKGTSTEAMAELMGAR
ncbi:MAG TPA: hypothetical protein PLB01_00065 [Thermoanaerobaculia bacterium]|nr:hypothetical protein [Thermoanaerobaculia bacterium]